jgi:hypothetical protein
MGLPKTISEFQAAITQEWKQIWRCCLHIYQFKQFFVVEELLNAEHLTVSTVSSSASHLYSTSYQTGFCMFFVTSAIAVVTHVLSLSGVFTLGIYMYISHSPEGRSQKA